MSAKRTVISWSLYDWANSVFAVTVISGFFPILFKQYWCVGISATESTARLGFANGIAGFCVAFASPFLGALANAGSMRKKLLAFFIGIGAVATALLAVTGAAMWERAAVLYIVASGGFFCGNLFYDSLLVSVAEPKKRDFVSSLGLSLGYIGGGLFFAAAVALTMNPQWLGLTKTSAAQVANGAVAVWWVVFSLPLFFFVKEPDEHILPTIPVLLSDTIRRLKTTFGKIKKSKSLLLFLLAYWLYIDGVGTFISMAVDFGLSMGFATPVMITALLMVQFVAFPAVLVFGRVSEKIGTHRAIMAGIVMYLLVTVIGTAILKTPLHFYILAGCIGLAQGCLQALSRSYFANSIPEHEATEYFGFYNLVGKSAVVAGPFLVGTTAFVLGHAGVAQQTASRISMGTLALLFIAGGTLFMFSLKARKDESR